MWPVAHGWVGRSGAIVREHAGRWSRSPRSWPPPGLEGTVGLNARGGIHSTNSGPPATWDGGIPGGPTGRMGDGPRASTLGLGLCVFPHKDDWAKPNLGLRGQSREQARRPCGIVAAVFRPEIEG